MNNVDELMIARNLSSMWVWWYHEMIYQENLKTKKYTIRAYWKVRERGSYNKKIPLRMTHAESDCLRCQVVFR